MDSSCLFNGCSNPPLPSGKCEAHKHRTKCAVDDCLNQMYARNVCIKHGGRQKCQFEGCTSNVRSQGFCCKHGPGNNKNLCQFEGCTRAAHARRRCVRHGGGQKCKMDNCTKFARTGGLCYHHGGALRQSSPPLGGSSPDDEDLLSCILNDSTLMQLASVDELLAEACNCDFDLTKEDYDMLDSIMNA